MARTKGSISQEILNKLSMLEPAVISKNASRFWPQLFNLLFRDQEIDKRKIKDAFYYLKKQDLIIGELAGEASGQLHIRLTVSGKKEAAKYRLSSLKVDFSKPWDKKWRLVIFSPAKKEKAVNQAFLKKLKELGFYPLQKNIWLMPFACAKEIKALRKFFNFEAKKLRLIETNDLEESKEFRQAFKLK